MPLAIVTYKRGCLHPDVLKKLGLIIQMSAALALNVDENPSAHLTQGDIEVRMREFGEFDRATADVAIFITANHYAERAVNLQERTATISGDVKNYLAKKGVTGYVWVELAHASFVPF